MNKSISVVIPAYNEAKNLGSGSLEKVKEYLEGLKLNYEVIVVDDGSSDDTVTLINDQIKNKNKFRLIKNPHSGKAVTVMTGLLEATGDLVFFTDMDLATPIEELAKLLPKFEEGFDVVIGARTGRKGAPLVRKISAWGFSVLRNLILGLPFQDTQCGFKGFTSGAIKKIFPAMLGRWKKYKASGGAVNAGFDVEMLFVAKQSGFKIADVPVVWHYVDSERVQVLSDAIQAIQDMIRIRIYGWKGSY